MPFNRSPSINFSCYEDDLAEQFFVSNPFGIKLIKLIVGYNDQKMAIKSLVIETIDKKSHLFFWDDWTDKGHPTVVYGNCFTDKELLEQQVPLAQEVAIRNSGLYEQNY